MENLLTIPIVEHEEKVQYSAKVHWISYVAPIILIATLSPWAFLALLTKHYTIVGIIILTAFIAGVMKILRNKSVKIYLTQNYLTVRIGVLNKRTIDIPLNKMEGIILNQSSVARMLDFGTLIVTTGQLSNSFKISNPMKFRNEIMRNNQAKYLKNR